MIDTERLVLRRWAPADLDPYAAICADPIAMRWIGDGATRSRDDCAAGIARSERAWEDNGFGIFAIESKASARCIGFVGLSVPQFLPEILPAVEIGWRIARDAWGKGLATEAARAARAFAFERAGSGGLDRIVSIHQVGNDASGRVMEKLGMRLERETVHPRYGRPLRVFELYRHAWESSFVYKVCPAAEWRAAIAVGVYKGSALDARDGFVHLSTAAQLGETVRRHFAGQRDLVLVAFDPRDLGADLRWEPSRGGDLFPHAYGTISPTLARRVSPLDVETA